MTQKKDPHSTETVTLQSWLRPALTTVSPNRDYEAHRAELDDISAALRQGSIEQIAIRFAMKDLPKGHSRKKAQKSAEFAVFALRVELLRHILGLPSFRAFSRMLASSDLLADFCGVLTIEGIKWSSKSTLERASKTFSDDQMSELNAHLCEQVSKSASAQQLGLEEAVDFSVCLLDTTCFEANIHFPVDWLLLKDVAENLLKALILVREQGVRCRMDESPQQWQTRINHLCIKMTHTRRHKDAKRARKAVLRTMKQELKRLAGHAKRHRDKLEVCKPETTKWSQQQITNLLTRIDEKLGLVPRAIEQAHERIIGERRVASKNKVLSAHEPDVHVIVRGKAGREVEFGNTLFIGETKSGFISDYQLYKERAPTDAKQLIASLERMENSAVDQPILEVVGDRGFDTKTVTKELKSRAIENCVCPKNPHQLKEKLSEATFRSSQKRRGGTEARIAILKGNGGGRVCRAKGFEHRALHIGWGVFAHNWHWIAGQIRKRRDAARAATKLRLKAA